MSTHLTAVPTRRIDTKKALIECLDTAEFVTVSTPADRGGMYLSIRSMIEYNVDSITVRKPNGHLLAVIYNESGKAVVR